MTFIIRWLPLRVILSNPFQLFLAHVYYRFRCAGSNLSVRECIRRGECGCDNSSRSLG